MIIIRCKVTDNSPYGHIHKISQVVHIVVFLWSCRGGGWESNKAIEEGDGRERMGEGDGRERMGIKVKSPGRIKKERIGSRLSLSLFQSVMVTDSLKIFVSCRGRMSCLRLNCSAVGGYSIMGWEACAQHVCYVSSYASRETTPNSASTCKNSRCHWQLQKP